MGNGPSNDLKQTFQDCLDDFNKAKDLGKYGEDFERYLHPTDPILIQRVDDPGSFVTGQRAGIMKYLNTPAQNGGQLGVFPQFKCDEGPPLVEQHTSQKKNVGAHVTGDGGYWDKYQDYPDKNKRIHVRFSLRFKNSDPSGKGVWLLVTANVAPI